MDLDARRYALYGRVDLSGLHGVQFRGRGHRSVVVLRGPTSESAFVATNTNDLAFRDFDFDGSPQAAVLPADTGGYGIDVSGRTSIDVRDVRAYRTNRAVLRAYGCDVYMRRIGVIGVGWRQLTRP